MIVCPNCNHPNPDGAVQCEACYTPLPATIHCPSCGATVQADAAFCGQCGYNLHSSNVAVVTPVAASNVIVSNLAIEESPAITPNPIQAMLQPEDLELNIPANSTLPPTTVVAEPVAEPIAEPVAELNTAIPTLEALESSPAPVQIPLPVASPVTASKTQLQQIVARVFHVQSNQEIELPQTLSVIHMGKPNDRIPPDIDVSGFANSEIVSRVHADIRVEGDAYYIEDVGSSNGTYVNNLPLLPGNRHRLRPGDRISLGKGDLVTFLFQLS
jgi:predicted component of type VI protein secretion system/ribosomal protein L40E